MPELESERACARRLRIAASTATGSRPHCFGIVFLHSTTSPMCFLNCGSFAQRSKYLVIDGMSLRKVSSKSDWKALSSVQHITMSASVSAPPTRKSCLESTFSTTCSAFFRVAFAWGRQTKRFVEYERVGVSHAHILYECAGTSAVFAAQRVMALTFASAWASYARNP